MFTYLTENYKIIFEIYIPFTIKPKTNRYLHKNNKRFIPNDVRKNLQSIVEYIKQNSPEHKTINRSCILFCEFYFKDNRKRDLDNLSKSLQDCLEDAGVIKNDALFDTIILKRVKSNDEGIYIAILSE